MNLTRANVLLTGAAGGIGRAIATALLEQGAAVLLADLDGDALGRLATGDLARWGHRIGTHVADITRPADRAALAEAARGFRGGVNVLLNNAGVSHLRLLDEQPAAQVSLALAVNVEAPIQLCRELLPHLRRQAEAHILNTGSVFGSIGYPGYTVYSASKFAMRGFSEALRRELAETRVWVHYLAPRATKTGINTPVVEAMNAELGVAMDDPDTVARAVVRMLATDDPEATVGWPEKFFARFNGVLPRLVDGAIRRQLPVILRHASWPATNPTTTTTPTPADAPADNGPAIALRRK